MVCREKEQSNFWSKCLELKIVWKILSGSSLETSVHRRHSCIMWSPNTPSTFVHIHSSFLPQTCASDLIILSSGIQSKTAACHCCCFRLERFQMILYEVMDFKTEHKQVLAAIGQRTDICGQKQKGMREVKGTNLQGS